MALVEIHIAPARVKRHSLKAAGTAATDALLGEQCGWRNAGEP